MVVYIGEFDSRKGNIMGRRDDEITLGRYTYAKDDAYLISVC